MFKDSEETIPSAEINDTSYEIQADFQWDETKTCFFWKTKKPNTKTMLFIKSTNIQCSILEQFLKFKECKSENNDAKGINVAQPI